MSAAALIAKSEKIVIKIGSVLVTDKAEGKILQGWLDAFAKDVQALRDQGKKIIIVSSGAVALGRKSLGIAADTPPADIPLEHKQAASAVGQFHLFNGYYKAFSALNIDVAQVLLTLTETENRRMHLNARATLQTLINKGIIPVINENDTVSTGEIRFGDNDRLAARVGQMIAADLVLLLSTTDGLYTKDPTRNADAVHIPLVGQITHEHIAMAGKAVPGLSTGGMKSKVEAAQASSRAGVALMIANGVEVRALRALVEDANTRSTVFLAQETQQGARKKWIQTHLKPKGRVIIDDGALAALKSGKSLLPIGVQSVEGQFERGDAVAIVTLSGENVGVGLSAYGAIEAARISGCQSADIEKILGYASKREMIHRNDMALAV